MPTPAGETTYGDISPRTAAYVQNQLLRRALPTLCLEGFGQGKPIPLRSTTQTVFRRYEALDSTANFLTEGVTGVPLNPTHTDVTATLRQIGSGIGFTDVMADTHEDPVLMEFTDMLGEQAGQMVERIRWGVLTAGTSVYYSNGLARNAVNTVYDLALQKRAVKTLKANNASQFTGIVRSTNAWGTQNVRKAYIGFSHTNMENDIRDAQSFKSLEDYGQIPAFDNEIGSVGDVRHLQSTIFEAFANAGGAAGANIESTGGAAADVYPMLIVARDAYGIVPLEGEASLHPMVVNPTPSASDPWAQRGFITWKSMQTTVILNDDFMTRLEAAVSQ